MNDPLAAAVAALVAILPLAAMLALRWALVARRMDAIGRRSWLSKSAWLVGLSLPASFALFLWNGSLALPALPAFIALVAVARAFVRRVVRGRD